MNPQKSLLIQTIILFQNLIQNAEANIDQNSCKNVILRKNELHCEFGYSNVFFTGQNIDNLTNADTYQVQQDLIQVSRGPQLISKDEMLIMMKFRELTDQNEICSLIYNTQLQTYSINCISTQPTYIVDNKFQFNITTQFSLEIQKTQNFNCSFFDYYQEGFFAFCYSLYQIKLVQLFKEQNILQQTIIFESENQNLQCLLQFHTFSNNFIIVYSQCKDWKIQIYENNSLKSEIDEFFLKENYNIEGNLLEFQSCQTSFIIILSSGGYLFNDETFKILIVQEDLKLKNIIIKFDCHCYLKFAMKDQANNDYLFSFYKKYQDIVFNTKKDFPNDIFQLQHPQSLLLVYEDYLNFYVNEILQQTIKIKFQNIQQHSLQKIFIGIDEGNQITFLFIKNSLLCLPFSYKNQQYYKYYFQFEYLSQQNSISINYQNCYKPIIIDDDNDKKKKEYAILINLEEIDIYTERNNYEEQFYIFLSKQSIFSIQPYRLKLSSSLDHIKFKYKSNQVKCQFNHYLKNYQGKFIIKTAYNSIYSIIVQGSENNLVEYNCQEKNIRLYQNISPLDEQTILRFEDQSIFLFLDKSKHCLYKVMLENYNLEEMPMKITCLDTQIEKVLNLQYISLKVKDQFVFYNLLFTQDQLQRMDVFISRQISQNFEDIFQIRVDFFLVIYSNELHVIFKETIVQRININCKIVGTIDKSKTIYLVNLILLDLNKNELQFYVLSLFEFRFIRSYNLDLYVPIQPPQFKMMDTQIIITCEQKITKKLFLLIFNCAAQISSHLLQQVIETKNQYFWVSHYYLYYFDSKNQLSIEDLMHINIEVENLEFTDKSSQDVILQFQVELEDSEIPPVKQDLAVTLLNPSIMKLTKKNSNIFIEYDNQEINFRNNVLGKIDNIFLNKNEIFILKYPLENEILMQCSYYCNKFCFQVTNSGDVTFFKVGQSKNIYLAYDLEHQVQSLLFIEVISENQFLLINQINDKSLSISLMILKDQILQVQKQIYFNLSNFLEEIRLVQNILFISMNQFEHRFLIYQDDINEVDFPNLNSYSLIDNIDSETYLEITVDTRKHIILINLFKIINSQVHIYQVYEISIKNYQVKEIFSGLASHLSSAYIKLIKQNYNFGNQELDLNIFFNSTRKLALIIQIHLYLREQKYELIIKKILRYPESLQACQFILIAYEDMILQCGITNYYYDLKTNEHLCDPIYSTKNLQQIEILNSTHFLFQNHFQHNQSVVLYAGKRGGYVLQKLSQEITYPIILEFKVISINNSNIGKLYLNYDLDQNDYLDQETFYLQANQLEIAQNQFPQLSFVIFILIFIILLAALIFYYRKKQLQKKKELGREVYKEISLSTIKLENSQNN